MPPYVKQPWVDNTTPVDATHMLHVEDGIFAADANATTALAQSLPQPVVNGKWIKGVGGVAVWADPPGTEYAHNEFTANTTITATTEAGAQQVRDASAVTFDGATAAIIEFFAPYIANPAAAVMLLALYDGAASIGIFAQTALGGNGMPMLLRRRLTPSATSHTYSVRAWVSSGSGTVFAGAGGAGLMVPGYLRITKA